MATVEINVECGIAPFYTHSLYYSDVDCATACASGTPVTVQSTCSTLALYCTLFNTSEGYASPGYYSDGTNCYYQGVYESKFLTITSTDSCTIYYYKTAFRYSCSTCDYVDNVIVIQVEMLSFCFDYWHHI